MVSPLPRQLIFPLTECGYSVLIIDELARGHNWKRTLIVYKIPISSALEHKSHDQLNNNRLSFEAKVSESDGVET